MMEKSFLLLSELWKKCGNCVGWRNDQQVLKSGLFTTLAYVDTLWGKKYDHQITNRAY